MRNGYDVKLSYNFSKQTFVLDECGTPCTKVDENANTTGDASGECAEIVTSSLLKEDGSVMDYIQPNYWLRHGRKHLPMFGR